jgi:hypothetical protein
MFVQPEAGIKFVPFVLPLRSFDMENAMPSLVYYIDRETYPEHSRDIVWLEEPYYITQKSYSVPDITLAVNLLIHGKKPQNNFIFGINANIGFMNRISFDYYTTNVLPEHLQSSGSYGLKSSYIGFHFGYQYMTGKKQ